MRWWRRLESQDRRETSGVRGNTSRFNLTNPTTGVTTLEKANSLRLAGVTGTNRQISFFTTNAGERWNPRTTDAAESGANAGSDLSVNRYDDTGA
jgi:hypothetical protein